MPLFCWAAEVDPKFRSYDMRYHDCDRVQEWAREYAQYEAAGSLPAFEIMRLPNDHTSGTQAGRPTPQAFVAENDAAVGKVVDIVSHSKDWKSTAIFITEDDAQNGPDHVDAHRTESLVVSPYTQRRSSKPFVDHTLYSTTAMLRTMELILGMKPLSQFDGRGRIDGCQVRGAQAVPLTHTLWRAPCWPVSYSTWHRSAWRSSATAFRRLLARPPAALLWRLFRLAGGRGRGAPGVTSRG